MIGFFDPLYFVFLAPGLLLAGWAAIKVKGNFNRYSRVRAASGMTGAQVAREILRRNNIHGVAVEQSEGMLTDHYDPRTRVVRLSPKVYGQPSVASVAIAAHEVGHAIQHATNYAPLGLRSAAVPLASVGSWAPWILMVLGAWFGMVGLIYLGIVLFCGVIAFQLITLPVEFNASTRARAQLQELGLVSAGDAEGVRRVLSAAAMTYVAAAVTAILTLLYYLFRLGIIGGGSDD